MLWCSDGHGKVKRRGLDGFNRYVCLFSRNFDFFPAKSVFHHVDIFSCCKISTFSPEMKGEKKDPS